MKNKKTKSRLRSVLTWIGWALLVQFILINISASLYAYRLTHLHSYDPRIPGPHVSNNILAKTWRLFTGITFYRSPLSTTPGFDFSTVILKTKNNIPIEVWLSKTDSIVKGTVILFHGLTGNKGMILDEAGAFRGLGYNVMMVDVRNHGNSGGNVTSIGYKESEEIKLAFDYVKQKGGENIFLWGASMGAVEIIKAVSDYHLKPSGIIIEMPFLSLQSHLKGRARILGFPEQPFGFFTSFWIGLEQGFNGLGFKTTNYAKDVTCPVLMQYGEKDDLVLPYETTAVYEAINTTNKKLVLYEEAAHESFLRKDPATWKREVAAFLERSFPVIF